MKLTAVPLQEPLPALLASWDNLGRVMGNDEIAEIFDNVADLLEVEDANPLQAHRNAARTLRALNFELAEIIARGEPLP